MVYAETKAEKTSIFAGVPSLGENSSGDYLQVGVACDRPGHRASVKGGCGRLWGARVRACRCAPTRRRSPHEAQSASRPHARCAVTCRRLPCTLQFAGRIMVIIMFATLMKFNGAFTIISELIGMALMICVALGYKTKLSALVLVALLT